MLVQYLAEKHDNSRYRIEGEGDFGIKTITSTCPSLASQFWLCNLMLDRFEM